MYNVFYKLISSTQHKILVSGMHRCNIYCILSRKINSVHFQDEHYGELRLYVDRSLKTENAPHKFVAVDIST